MARQSRYRKSAGAKRRVLTRVAENRGFVDVERVSPQVKAILLERGWQEVTTRGGLKILVNPKIGHLLF